MATTFMESGAQATQGLEFWGNTSGTVAYSTTQKEHGSGSIKYTTGAAGQVAYTETPAGVAADAGTRTSFWFRMTDLPTTSGAVVVVLTSGGTSCFRISMTSAGVLQLFAAAQLGTNGATLSVDTWYRITLAYTVVNTTTNEIRVYVNGALSISVTNGTIAATATNKFRYGWTSGTPGNVKVRYLQGFYVDNLSTLADTGTIRVTFKRPLSNGTLNNYTTQIGIGGSGYGTGHAPQVNENPLSTTNGWSMIAIGSAVTEQYTIEGASVGDVDITGQYIVDYAGWVYTKALNAETGQLVLNGVSNPISITTSNALFTAFSGSTSYPIGGADIGEICSTTITTVSLYECGILFAYSPPLLQTLSDAFNAGSLNTGLWTEFTAGSATTTYDATGAQVNFPASSTSSTDGDISSNIVYNLTGSYAYVNILTVPSSSTSADAEIRLKFDASTNWFRWVYEAGTLYAQYRKAGSNTTAFSVAYDSSVHKYWKISESGGVVTWATSVDGSSYTTRATFTHGMQISSTTVLIAGTCFQNESNPGTYKWNNFNTIPVVTSSGTSTMTMMGV